MPSFENPMKKLLRTDRDLQLLKNVRKFVRADGTFSGGGGAITVVQPLQSKLPPATNLTIASGVITVTQSHHTIGAEGGAGTDDLVTINGLVANQLYVLRPVSDSQTIVIKNGSGNIDCIGGADISLDDIEDWCWVLSPDGVRAYVLCDTQAAPGGGAATTEPFITHAATGGLSNERVLAPQAAYTPVGGVGFVNAGTDGGAITATLKDLTADWEQAGAFALSWLPGRVHPASISNGGFLRDATVVTHTASVSRTHIMNYLVPEIAVDNTFTLSGEQTALLSGWSVGSGNAGTIAALTAWKPLLAIQAGVVTTGRMIHIGNASGAGTLTTQYGIDIDALTKGGTNVGVRNNSTLRQVAALTVGADAAVTSGMIAEIVGALRVDGVQHFDGESAPSTPASDDAIIYNETGTDELKVLDDSGNKWAVNRAAIGGAYVESPVNGDRIPLMRFHRGSAKLKEISACLRGSSTPSVQWNLYYGSDLSGAGTAVWSSDKTTTSTTTGDNFTAFDNNSPADNDWLWMKVNAAVGGTVNGIIVSVDTRYP